MVGFGDIWSDKLETGIPHIDEHHRKIVRLLLDVHNASAAGGSPETVKAVLADLLSYTKYHFGAEERLMLELKYPRLGEQRVAHQWFAEKLQTHFLGISAKSLESTRELFAFLRSWYGEHILKLDMDLAAWVREHSKG